MKQVLALNLFLLTTGIVWGLTNPLAKLSVSTGYQPLGVMFWQLVTILVLSGAACLYRHGRLPLRRDSLAIFAWVAFLGTLIPDYLLYLSAARLPAGILSALLAMVPVFSMPMALLLGLEKPVLRRVLGVVCGAGSILLIFGQRASLPDPGALGFAALALAAAGFYAAQGIYVTWRAIRGLDAIQMLFGSSVVAFVLVAPGAVLSGQFVNLWRPWGQAEWAILGTSVFHALAYGGYFALLSRAGPVFTSQVAFVVTGSGVLWSMALLGETYSLWVWAGFALMFAGIALLQPRPPRAVRLPPGAPPPGI